MPRKKSTTIYLDEDVLRQLRQLSSRTKVPIAAYIREDVELVLQRHKRLLPRLGDAPAVVDSPCDS